MSNGANSGTPTPAAGQQSFLRGLFHQISAVTIVSVIGTLLVSYFQNISSYDDKVAALAEEDMAAATQAFTNMSSSLSTAVSLQQRLIGNFYNAICKDVDAVYKRIDPNCKDVHQDDNAYLTKSARIMYKDYMDTYADFHQKYNLLAQEAEIYLDFRKRHYYRSHTFDHYMVFSVDSEEKRNEPKVPPVEPNEKPLAN